jgi:hypothetical protein
MGFEAKITAGERPQTYALDIAATGTGRKRVSMKLNKICPTAHIVIR